MLGARTFHTVYGNIGSTEELDRIAVENAGRLGSYGGGYAMPEGLDEVPGAPEWGTKVIGTGGTANGGTIILVGKSPRTRRLLWEGKTALLIRQGIPVEVARVAASQQYGMEVSVARLATALVSTVRKNGPYKGHSHADMDDWMSIGTDWDALRGVPKLSWWRRYAAANIAAEVMARTPASVEEPVIGSVGVALLAAGIEA